MFQRICAIVAAVAVVAAVFVPAIRITAAILFGLSVFALGYSFVVVRPRLLAVLVALSVVSFPFIFILAFIPMALFGAPLAWHLADRLFRPAKYAPVLVGTPSSGPAQLGVDDAGHPGDTFRVNGDPSVDRRAELSDDRLRIH
jgi:hypothetical protein